MAEWFEGLDAEGQQYVAGKGWNKPAGDAIASVMDAYRHAEKT